MKDIDHTRKQFKQRILLMHMEDKALKKNTFKKVIKTLPFWVFKFLSFRQRGGAWERSNLWGTSNHLFLWCSYFNYLSVPGAYLMFMFKILNCNENMVRVENINHLNGAIINKEMTRNKWHAFIVKIHLIHQYSIREFLLFPPCIGQLRKREALPFHNVLISFFIYICFPPFYLPQETLF